MPYTLLLLLTYVCLRLQAHPPGHLKPLGSHRPPEGEVFEWHCPGSKDTIGSCFPPINEFIEMSGFHEEGEIRPVLMRNAIGDWKAMHKWTDAYFNDILADEPVAVEREKKETRADASEMRFGEFLDKYEKEDQYFIVDTVPEPLLGDISFRADWLAWISELEKPMWWMSSGGTVSVLHQDASHNVNCIISGEKEWIIIDDEQEPLLYHTDRHPGYGHRSLIDVESVNMETFPLIGRTRWWHAKQSAGDCLFLPARWFHTVTSHHRNIATNFWFEARYQDFPEFPGFAASEQVSLDHEEVVFRTFQEDELMDLLVDFVVDLGFWLCYAGFVSGFFMGMFLNRVFFATEHGFERISFAMLRDVLLFFVGLIIFVREFFEFDDGLSWYLMESAYPSVAMVVGLVLGICFVVKGYHEVFRQQLSEWCGISKQPNVHKHE